MCWQAHLCVPEPRQLMWTSVGESKGHSKAPNNSISTACNKWVTPSILHDQEFIPPAYVSYHLGRWGLGLQNYMMQGLRFPSTALIPCPYGFC